MNWNQYYLRDILKLMYGKSLPERDRQNGDIPVYGSGGIGGFHNLELVKGPGVIVGRKGTVGSVFFEQKDFFPIDTVYYVDVYPEKVQIKFSYYLLKSLPLSSLNTDAAVPGLNRERALSLQVKIPPLDTQNRISCLLENYDELIKNNTRRIELLEESGRLLYREWFIHLRFPGHEHAVITNGVPEDWEKTSLGQYSKLNYGKALKAENRIEGNFAVYGSSGIVGSHNAALAKGPAIIVGRKGNVGSVYWSSRDCWPIDTVYFIDTDKANLYLYYALQFMQFINTDVAVPGLNRDLAHSRPLIIPSPRILNEFLLAAAPIRQQIEKLEELNQKLAQARDLLIPRLMNGEITV